MSDWLQRDVTSSGVRLRVLEVGRGPAVLLLHGMFFDRTTWRAVMAALSSDYYLVAPDLPGFGDSEKPPPGRFAYNLECFADAVAGLYAGLGLGRTAMVGHALGATVVLTVAARHPELVSRIVLVDALCFEEKLDLRLRAALLPLVGSFAFKQLWGKSTFRGFFRSRLLGPQAHVAPDRIDRYYASFNAPAARGSALATLRATRDTRPVVAQLGRIRSPALVVWGRDDRLLPVRHAQQLAKGLRGARLELLDCGHSPQEERPEELATAIRRFLDHPRPGSSSA